MIYLIFSSIEFLLWFLPVFLIAYGITPSKYRNLTLLIGSIVFYAMGDAGNLAPLMISVLCNYFIGLHLAKRSPRTLWRKRLLFVTALSINIGILIWFKCRGGSAGLPLGISFYTFQILSYLIDVYRGDADREYSFLKFATYVVMFPKLISGPITRYGEVKDSLYNRTFTMQGLEDGMKLFVLGLAAKVLLADRVGILWHEVQVTGFESISTPLAWLAAIAYSMEIYFDFWGYSLMAMGLGRMLGIELSRNFHRPYMARGVRDFYRRWHMTLGQWFCRYVYIPLGGSRRGELCTIFNLLVVWMLTAFWHGAGWNFFCWGGLLWICIVLERQLGRLKFVHKMKVLPHIYLWLIIPVSWMCGVTISTLWRRIGTVSRTTTVSRITASIGPATSTSCRAAASRCLIFTPSRLIFSVSSARSRLYSSTRNRSAFTSTAIVVESTRMRFISDSNASVLLR